MFAEFAEDTCAPLRLYAPKLAGAPPDPKTEITEVNVAGLETVAILHLSYVQLAPLLLVQQEQPARLLEQWAQVALGTPEQLGQLQPLAAPEAQQRRCSRIAALHD